MSIPARKKLIELSDHLAKMKASPRMKLYTAMPGVREAVELIDKAEALLVELVSEVERRHRREGVERE